MPIDYSKYPANWKSEIIPAILERAGHCCEECGLQNKSFIWAIRLDVRTGKIYKARSIWFRNEDDAIRESMGGIIRKIKIVLTVAHLDHDEFNHDIKLERLKAWCQVCHLRYDAKEKYRRSFIKWKS